MVVGLAVILGHVLLGVDAVNALTPKSEGKETLPLSAAQIDVNRTVQEVVFPPGSQQGAKSFWVVDLHLSIRIVSSATKGQFRIDCGTNGASAALMIFQRTSSTHIELRTHDLFEGQRRIQLKDGLVEVRYRNYLQILGVAPGKAKFYCTPEGSKNIGVAAVTIRDGSTIYQTLQSPSPVMLHVKSSVMPESIHQLSFVVESIDSRNLGDVVVAVHAPDPSAVIVGRHQVRFQAA